MTKILPKISIGILIILASVSGLIAYRRDYISYRPLSVFFILTAGYLLWALIHHALDRSLRGEIMIEYLLTALLALIILIGLQI